MSKINMSKQVWEGWSVGDFIKEVAPQLDIIMSGKSFKKPPKTKEELAKMVTDMQPYYKKPIKDVINYFCEQYKELLNN